VQAVVPGQMWNLGNLPEKMLKNEVLNISFSVYLNISFCVYLVVFLGLAVATTLDDGLRA